MFGSSAWEHCVGRLCTYSRNVPHMSRQNHSRMIASDMPLSDLPWQCLGSNDRVKTLSPSKLCVVVRARAVTRSKAAPVAERRSASREQQQRGQFQQAGLGEQGPLDDHVAAVLLGFADAVRVAGAVQSADRLGAGGRLGEGARRESGCGKRCDAGLAQSGKLGSDTSKQWHPLVMCFFLPFSVR